MPRPEQRIDPKQLKAWREELNLTQTEAASLLGYQRRQFANWETGFAAIPKAALLACTLIALLTTDKKIRYEEIRDKLDEIINTYFT